MARWGNAWRNRELVLLIAYNNSCPLQYLKPVGEQRSLDWGTHVKYVHKGLGSCSSSWCWHDSRPAAALRSSTSSTSSTLEQRHLSRGLSCNPSSRAGRVLSSLASSFRLQHRFHSLIYPNWGLWYVAAVFHSPLCSIPCDSLCNIPSIPHDRLKDCSRILCRMRSSRVLAAVMEQHSYQQSLHYPQQQFLSSIYCSASSKSLSRSATVSAVLIAALSATVVILWVQQPHST